jgi:hypothetical protein
MSQQAFRDAGVISTILDILDIHKKDANVLKSALPAVEALANDPTNRRLFVEAGAVDKIINLISNWVDNEEITNACVNTLTSLAETSYVGSDEQKG